MDGRILLLDYNKADRERAKFLLKKIGDFEIIEVTGTYEFYPLLDTFTNVSLIIIDIAFPYEEEGFHVLSFIRKTLGNDVPVIIATKSSRLENRNEAQKFSVTDFIVKPYESDRFESSIRSIIHIEEKFEFTTSDISGVSFSFENFLKRELKFSNRFKNQLSILYITPRQSELVHVQDFFTSENFSHMLYDVQQKLRASDQVFIKNNDSMIIVLPFTSSHGAESVSKKVSAILSPYFMQHGLNFEGVCNATCVTSPEEGTDILSLFETASKKIMHKEMLRQIDAVPDSTRQYADKLYNRFNIRRWF